MDVDEPGCHHKTFGVEDLGIRRGCERADGGDAVALDQHIGPLGRAPRSVMDLAAADQDPSVHDGTARSRKAAVASGSIAGPLGVATMATA